MEVKITCPLGSECETIRDNKLERCAWYIKLQGKNPQTGENVDSWKCAMAWQPILMIEGNGATQGIAASVQSLRNENVKRQNLALEIMTNGKKILTTD